MCLVWSKDGTELLLGGLDGMIQVVDVKTTPSFATGTPRPLFKIRQEVVTGTGTHDLNRFLVAIPVGAAAPPSLVLELNWMSAIRK